MLLNKQWITEGIKKEIKKYLETNDKENTTIQNIWDAAKAVLRGNSTQYSVMTYVGIESKKRVDICICITDSLCCTAETNTTL